MAELSKIADPLEACTAEGRKEAWQACLDDVEVVEKSLNKFLSMKRLRFPRFYFVADAALLEGERCGSNSRAVMTTAAARSMTHLRHFASHCCSLQRVWRRRCHRAGANAGALALHLRLHPAAGMQRGRRRADRGAAFGRGPDDEACPPGQRRRDDGRLAPCAAR
eukprot:7281265-Prymnesium_polylepis.2